MKRIFFHHDKASSHTSTKTQNYLKTVSEKTGLSYIKKDDIPVKSPDCSPLDFYGFGMLKQKLENRKAQTLAGVWKHANSIWNGITIGEIERVFESWKRRCRMIVKKRGLHLQRTKEIHKHKTLL